MDALFDLETFRTPKAGRFLFATVEKSGNKAGCLALADVVFADKEVKMREAIITVEQFKVIYDLFVADHLFLKLLSTIAVIFLRVSSLSLAFMIFILEGSLLAKAL